MEGCGVSYPNLVRQVCILNGFASRHASRQGEQAGADKWHGRRKREKWFSREKGLEGRKPLGCS